MQTRANNSTGLGYFYLARGLGMVLILLGHSMSPFYPMEEPTGNLFSGAGSVLGGGIMAMFFLISGFGFYCRSPRKCWKTQYKLLLKPYWITAAAILATKLLLALVKQRPFAENGAELVLTYLLGLNAEGGGELLGIRVDSVSILWFVLALFGGWILCNGIYRLKSGALRAALAAGCVIGGWGLTRISDVWPFCLPMALMAVGYLAAGHEMHRRDLLERKLPLWSGAIVAAVCLCCGAFGGVNMVTCRWELGLLDVAGSFCVGFLLLRGYVALMRANLRGRLVGLLETVGFHSVWIVFLHGYEKVIFPWYRLGRLLPECPALCAVLCLVLRCGVIFVLMKLVQWIQRRMRKSRAKPVITITP